MTIPGPVVRHLWEMGQGKTEEAEKIEVWVLCLRLGSLLNVGDVRDAAMGMLLFEWVADCHVGLCSLKFKVFT